MIFVMAGHSRNQNRFTFFELRHEIKKNTEKEELIGNVLQEGPTASIQSSNLLLVHAGVFSGFLPKAKNMHRRLVAIDIIIIYHLQRSFDSFFPHLHNPAQSFFEGVS